MSREKETGDKWARGGLVGYIHVQGREELQVYPLPGEACRGHTCMGEGKEARRQAGLG